LVESGKYAVSAKFDESAKCLVMTQQKFAVSAKNDIFGLNMVTEAIGVCK